MKHDLMRTVRALRKREHNTCFAARERAFKTGLDSWRQLHEDTLSMDGFIAISREDCIEREGNRLLEHLSAVGFIFLEGRSFRVTAYICI